MFITVKNLTVLYHTSQSKKNVLILKTKKLRKSRNFKIFWIVVSFWVGGVAVKLTSPWPLLGNVTVPHDMIKLKCLLISQVRSSGKGVIIKFYSVSNKFITNWTFELDEWMNCGKMNLILMRLNLHIESFLKFQYFECICLEK